MMQFRAVRFSDPSPTEPKPVGSARGGNGSPSSSRHLLKIGLAFLGAILLTAACDSTEDGFMQRRAQGLASGPEPGSLFVLPRFLEFDEEETISYEEGLVFVPENREDGGARMIGIHFLRFPGPRGTDLPPVFYLPGGPGSTATAEELRETVQFFTDLTDLVYVDQRGNPDAPYQLDLRFFVDPLPLNQPRDTAAYTMALRRGFEAAMERWESRRADLSGYDILHLVEDVDQVRKSLGYEQIILRGNSFGSQSSLAYIRQHPEHVARAFIGGTEPLSHTYDMPSHVWNATKAMAALGDRAPELAQWIPAGGLAQGIVGLLESLGEEPREVTIPDAQTGDSVTVVLGPRDLQTSLKPYAPDYYTRNGFARWPRFILEMLHGDFRYLAALAVHNRTAGDRSIISLTIDNSIGSSEEMDREIRQDPARDILGPINQDYFTTRDLSPTPVVDASFREPVPIPVPTLVIQGTLDRSTPVENALFLEPSLEAGHLLIVDGGTHMAIDEVWRFCPEIAQEVTEFLRTGDVVGIPERISLSAPPFEGLEGPSLFDRLKSGAVWRPGDPWPQAECRVLEQ